MTALHIAAKKGHIDVCEVLLSRGASFYDEQASALSPLDRAVEDNNVELLLLFLTRLRSREESRIYAETIGRGLMPSRRACLTALLEYGNIEARREHLTAVANLKSVGLLGALIQCQAYADLLSKSLVWDVLDTNRKVDCDAVIETPLSTGKFRITGDDEILLALDMRKSSSAKKTSPI